MLAWIMNFTTMVFHSVVSHIEVNSRWYHSQSDCLHGNHDGAHGHLPSVTRPSPCVILKAIRTEVGWVWLVLVYKTTLNSC